jgi:hypothetical protein
MARAGGHHGLLRKHGVLMLFWSGRQTLVAATKVVGYRGAWEKSCTAFGGAGNGVAASLLKALLRCFLPATEVSMREISSMAC